MDIFLQLVWNGLITGSLIALVALGLTLIYGIAGFIQFAHGEIAAIGAYSFLWLHKLLDWPFIPAGIGAIVIGVGIGLVLEYVFFRPVRNKDSMVPLVISIGLSIGLQAILLILFGANIQTITDTSFSSYEWFGGNILATPNQVLSLIFSLGLMGALTLWLKKTKTGKMIRAVSSNQKLGQMFGLSPDVAMRWVFGIGSALAVLAGIFLAFEQNLEPTMGVQIGIKAFAALILGAVGSVRGAIVGAYIIGLMESLLVGFGIIASGFTAAIPFVILIAMLLIKPEGLFGKRFTALRK
jgi:branched-chain amino acid transport system permease protein